MFANQTLLELFRHKLKESYNRDEIRLFAFLILEDMFHLPLSEIVTRKFNDLSDNEKQTINHVIQRLLEKEPIQYIVGTTEFYGLKFKVTPSVLIPRPETEELVEWITASGKDVPRILDIGTGSGCIAISLAKLLPGSNVEAWDISQEALDVAQHNAQLNNVKVSFKKVNVLQPYVIHTPFDIIVSNPPYIQELEKKTMDENVLNYEPHTALFVEGNNALIFYDRIAELALNHLSEDGVLYFEISHSKGEKVVNLLKEKGFKDIELQKDISGNNRMIRAKN